MTSTTPFATKITGTGSAFPQKRLSNEELAKRVETNDEWIRERTGIRERRVSNINDENEHNSSMGALAATRALEMAGKRPEDLDAIIYATCSPDTLVPSTACWLQKKIGAVNAWGLDVNAACSGFVFGLSTADAFIRAGQYKTILIVGGEVLSSFVNWDDRGTCILFGDGVGAAIAERTSPSDTSRILSTHLGTDGKHWELFHMVAGGSNMNVTPEVHAQKLDKMQMKGKEMFKVAVKTLADYATRALEANNLTVKDLDWVVPHQANLRIIEAVANRLDFPMDRVIVNIGQYANTSSATVPTALDEAIRDGRIKKGQTVLLDVFGAGLTYGSVLMKL